MDASWIWLGVAIYVVFAGATAFLSRAGKSTSMSHYFLGNRQMNGFVSAMSYSATANVYNQQAFPLVPPKPPLTPRPRRQRVQLLVKQSPTLTSSRFSWPAASSATRLRA